MTNSSYMKIITLIFLLLISQFYIGCNLKPKQEKQKVATKSFAFTQEVEDQEPPPANLKTKFRNVYDWLSSICDKNKPSKNIQTYNFGLFESPKENVLFLIGTNTYQDKNHSTIRIEFRPNDIFYRLPNKGYQNLKRDQLIVKLTSELKDFTTTVKFKSSFLAKANIITTDFTGEIWKK